MEYVSIIPWVVVLAVAMFVALFGIALAYHWFRYAMNPKVAVTAVIVYTIVSAALLLLLISSAAVIS